jgi:hypothetical protein
VVHIEPPFIADSEPPEFVEPCEAALDHPSMATELLTGLDAAPGDAWLDMATQAGAPATPVIVGFVCVQLVGSAFWSAALTRDGRHSIEQVLERYAVVDVGPGQQKGERDAVSIRDQMAFGARPASVGRVRTCRGTPFLAAMEELSAQARLQSMRSASRSWRSSSRCRRSHTPAACQSRSRRQQVTPDPHPISAGSISQGMPVRSTNRIPVNAARAGTGGRPPLGLGEAGGSSGSIISQSDSGKRGAGIPSHESDLIRVQGF